MLATQKHPGVSRRSRAEYRSPRFISGLLLVSMLLLAVFMGGPPNGVQAQGISLPAEINKSFNPITILPGQVSRLSVTIYNPNSFVLTNAGWTDNLPADVFLANPVNAVTACGGTVTATAGGTSFSLQGGTVPPQVGVDPGMCTVSVDVTSTIPGNKINTIPANELTSTGAGGVSVTNTTPASATLQVSGMQAPSVNKGFDPNTIWAGGTSVLTINVINNDLSNALTNTSLTDTLPAGVVLANPVSANLNNCGAGTVSAAPGASTITLNNATIAPNSTCRIRVTVTSATEGTHTNTIPPGSVESQQGVTNASPASAALSVQSIGLLKDFAADSIPAGGATTLTITLQNPTGTAYTGAHLTDTLPGVLIIADSPAPVNNCGGTLTATPGTQLIELTGGTIPASTNPPVVATCTIVVTVTAPLNATATTLTNTIDAGELTTTQGVTNPLPATDQLRIRTALTANKFFSPNTITAGDTSTLTVTLRNYTAEAFTGVNFTDTLPAGLTVVGTPASPQCGGTITSTTASVTLTGGTIPTSSNPPTTSGFCTIVFQVFAAEGGSYRNLIPVGGVTTDQGASNVNQAASTLNVSEDVLPVNSRKTFSPTTINAGDSTRLRIDVIAPPDTNLTNLTITDVLPAGVTVSNSIDASVSNCGANAVYTAPTGATTISLTNGTVLSGQTCRITVYVTSSTPGVVTNVIPAQNITYTEDRPLNTTPSADLTVTSLAIGKAFTPPTVNPNGISRLTITLTNQSPSRLVNVSVTDNLAEMGGTAPDSGVFIAASPNAATTCEGGIVTANANTQLITMTNGIIPAQVGTVAGICTISVDVQGRGADTTYTNTIPVSDVSGTVEGTTSVINPTAEATAPLTIGNLQIVVNKAFNPLTVFGGSASTMSIELRNPDSGPLSGIAFTDVMPVGMIIADPPNFNLGTCDGTLNGTVGTNTITYSGGTLAGGATCTLTLSVTMVVNGNLTNSIPAGAVTTTNGVSNPQAADATLTNLPGASISKSFSPNSIPAGSDHHSLLTITIRNTSSFGLTGLGLIDNLPGTLPDGVVVAAAPASVNTCGGTLTAAAGTQLIQLSGGTLGGNATCTLTVPVYSAVPGVFVNTINPGSLTNDQGATNNQEATDTLTVTAAPALTIAKTLTAVGPFALGSTLTYDIVVTNTGGIPLTGVTVTDAGVGATLGTCTPVQPATLAPGETLTCPASHVVTQADIDTASYTNTAVGDSDQTPPATDIEIVPLPPTDVANTPMIGIAKRVVGTPVSVSTGVWDVTIAMLVRNYGNVTLTNVRITDDLRAAFPLPTTFTVRSITSSDLAVNPGFDGSLDQNLLAGSDTLQVGESGTLTLVLRVTPTSAGPYLNTAVAIGTAPDTSTVTDRSQDGVDPNPGPADGNPTNNNDPTPVQFDTRAINPPVGIKLVNETSPSILKWTVIWINSANAVAIDAEAYDAIPDGTTFIDTGVPSGFPRQAGAPAGSTSNGVICTDESGATSTQYCYYEGPTTAFPRGRVVWRGTLGPDLGAKDAAAAANEIQISFNVRVNAGVNNVKNAAFISIDKNEDGDFTDIGEFDTGIVREEWIETATDIEEEVVGLIPDTGFAPGLVSALPLQPSDKVYSKEGLTLEIPAIRAQMPIVGVPQTEKGYDVTWLSGAGWLNGTAYPSWEGNSVITGHVWDAFNQPGPFANIKSLKYGDQIRIHMNGQIYIYEVRANRLVRPDQTAAVFKHEEKAWVTLVTCEEYNVSSDTYAKRRMVRAVLIKVIPEK